MQRLLFAGFLLLAIGSAPGLAAPLCAVDTLANYEALGASGCQVGYLTVKSFTYSFVSGTVTIPDTSIIVTPTAGAATLGLKFSSNQFSVSGSNSAVYLLAYTWDPGDIRSLEDILNTNTPVFPGLAKISTQTCRDAAFTGSTCPTATDLLVVSHDGVTANTTATVAFTPSIGTLGLRNTIELDGNGASAQFTSFENVLVIPEPSTMTSCLILALVWRRLRLKRS